MPASEAVKHADPAGLGYAVIDDEDVREADLCIVFGGDGTVLRALGRLLDSDVPTLGVNYGNVGFLAALPREDWETQLQSILRGQYRIVELLTVDARVNGCTHRAVNDVILTRVAPRHVLQLEYEGAGVTVGDMSCDGLIVAAPAGSTAYNLSCGGPIVEWNADVLILNFIAPHSLAFRPVILHPSRAIIARNVSPSQEAEVVVDGAPVARLARGGQITMRAGAARARLLVTAEGSFFHNVEQKLFDRRNAR